MENKIFKEGLILRIPTRVYRFIEYELYKYDDYKKALEQERENILKSGGGYYSDGMPKGNGLANISLDKTMELNESLTIISLERSINAVDVALRRLNETHHKIFDNIYRKGRTDIYLICDELGISDRTFQRYKNKIIETAGVELGAIKSLA